MNENAIHYNQGLMNRTLLLADLYLLAMFSGEFQHVMKKVDLPVVPHAQCQEYLRKTRLGKHFRLHPNFLCAGGEEGKDACTVSTICQVQSFKPPYEVQSNRVSRKLLIMNIEIYIT